MLLLPTRSSEYPGDIFNFFFAATVSVGFPFISLIEPQRGERRRKSEDLRMPIDKKS
jgi:hypothetical protein